MNILQTLFFIFLFFSVKSIASTSETQFVNHVYFQSHGEVSVFDMIDTYKSRLNEMNGRIKAGENKKNVLNIYLEYAEKELKNQTSDSYIGRIAFSFVKHYLNEAKRLVRIKSYDEAQKYINSTFGYVVNLF